MPLLSGRRDIVRRIAETGVPEETRRKEQPHSNKKGLPFASSYPVWKKGNPVLVVNHVGLRDLISTRR